MINKYDWAKLRMDFPYEGQSGIVEDRPAMFEWVLENLSEPATYCHAPGDWSRVWQKMTKRLYNRSLRRVAPRKELFRFKNENDRILFVIRWA